MFQSSYVICQPRIINIENIEYPELQGTHKNYFSHTSYVFHSRPFTVFVAVLWTISNRVMPFLHYGAPNCTQYLRWSCTIAEQSWPIPSLNQISTLCLMHPSVRLALLDARAHSSLIFNWLSTKTHMISFLQGSSPASVFTGLPHPRYRIWHLFLFSFMELVIAQPCYSSRALCKASLPLRKLTAPPVVIWKLSVHSSPEPTHCS